MPRKRRNPQTVVGAAVVALILGSPALVAAQAPTGSPYDFLRHEIGFGEDELLALAGGQPITKVIDTSEKREIAVAGAVRIEASTSFFLRMFRAIESFDTAAQASRELSDPPVAADFEALRVPEEDLRGLAGCRPDDCDMKLGADAISRLQQEIDWSAPDAGARAQAILREQALASAITYLNGGHRALGSYRDKERSERFAEDFEELLGNAPYVLSYRPDLHRYLLEYPEATLEGATDFLYWGEYDYGKPVLRMSHVTIQPAGEGDNAPATIAVKHLWFTHHFTTGLALHVLVPDERAGDAFHLVSLSRLRTDGSGGMVARVLKKRIVADVLKGVQAYLTLLESAVERYYQAEVG